MKKLHQIRKNKQFGSPRFDLEWMKILEKIYKKKTKNDNKKIKVAFFLRPTSFSYDGIIKLLNQLKVMNNIEIKLNYKPRDVFPTKCSNISKSDMQSSELIMGQHCYNLCKLNYFGQFVEINQLFI